MKTRATDTKCSAGGHRRTKVGDSFPRGKIKTIEKIQKIEIVQIIRVVREVFGCFESSLSIYTFQFAEFRKCLKKLLCCKRRVIQQPTGTSPKTQEPAVPHPEEQPGVTFWLAESMSVYHKQCENVKLWVDLQYRHTLKNSQVLHSDCLRSCRFIPNVKLKVQRFKIENDWRFLRSLRANSEYFGRSHDKLVIPVQPMKFQWSYCKQSMWIVTKKKTQQRERNYCMDIINK